MDALRRLGARSVPVLSRGDNWIFAQNIGHVVKFLGLSEAAGPVLSPSELMERKRAKVFPADSSTLWLKADESVSVRATGTGPAHLLRIVLLEH